jgi:hypothetical protein
LRWRFDAMALSPVFSFDHSAQLPRFQQKRCMMNFHSFPGIFRPGSGTSHGGSGLIEPWTQNSNLQAHSVEPSGHLPPAPIGKWREMWAGFALKCEHLTPIMSSTTIGHLRNHSRGDEASLGGCKFGQSACRFLHRFLRKDGLKVRTNRRNRRKLGEIGSTQEFSNEHFRQHPRVSFHALRAMFPDDEWLVLNIRAFYHLALEAGSFLVNRLKVRTNQAQWPKIGLKVRTRTGDRLPNELVLWYSFPQEMEIRQTMFCAPEWKLVTTALEWSYAQGEKDVSPKHLEAAAELLTLRRDTIHGIDVQSRKDEGEGKKREVAKETHEPPPKWVPTFNPSFLGWRLGQEVLNPAFSSEPSAYLPFLSPSRFCTSIFALEDGLDHMCWKENISISTAFLFQAMLPTRDKDHLARFLT